MAAAKVHLDWTGEGLSFRGRAGDDGPEMVFDSDATVGPSPTQSLLGSLAACMGIDVVMILEKSRVPVEALGVTVEAERAETPPKYFTAATLTYTVKGPGPDDEKKLQRAIELSRDRYCSVLHSLRPDLDLEIRIERA